MKGALRSCYASSVIDFHVTQALGFLKRQNMYFCLGREEPWEDEVKPPVPDLYDDIESPWGFKRVEKMYLVIPSSKGSIEYTGQRFSLVKESEAYEQKARWVFVHSKINYDELPFKTYRQIGLTQDLVPIEGLPAGQYALTNNQVKDRGILQFLNNRPPIGRSPDMREELSLILEF